MSETGAEDASDTAETRNPIVKLREYAIEERRFVHEAIQALVRARDPLLARIPTEPSGRLQTTQITTQGGEVVQQPPVEIRSRVSQSARGSATAG